MRYKELLRAVLCSNAIIRNLLAYLGYVRVNAHAQYMRIKDLQKSIKDRDKVQIILDHKFCFYM